MAISNVIILAVYPEIKVEAQICCFSQLHKTDSRQKIRGERRSTRSSSSRRRRRRRRRRRNIK